MLDIMLTLGHKDASTCMRYINSKLVKDGRRKVDVEARRTREGRPGARLRLATQEAA
jgi:hypothetical protein